MRKFVLALAVAGSAVLLAAPAVAQYYPASPPSYGYAPDRWSEVHELQERIERVERQINHLDQRDVIRDHSADKLRHDVQRLERRLARASRNGLNPYEANDIRARITQLESRVQFAIANDGRRYDRW